VPFEPLPQRREPSASPTSDFFQWVAAADVILWAGESASHMLANTMRDALDLMPRKAGKKEMVLLTDATRRITPRFSTR
jgi:hypothetical protein